MDYIHLPFDVKQMLLSLVMKTTIAVKDGYKPNQPLDKIGPNQAHVSRVNPSCQAVINHPQAVTSSCQRVITHTFDLIQLWRYTLSILFDLWGDLWYWSCIIHRLLEHELWFVTQGSIDTNDVTIISCFAWSTILFQDLPLMPEGLNDDLVHINLSARH
jgi:hypothetical protein